MKTQIEKYNETLKSLIEKGTSAEVSVTTDEMSKAVRYSNVTVKVVKDTFLAFIPIRGANLLRLTSIDFLNKKAYFIVFEDDLVRIIESNKP